MLPVLDGLTVLDLSHGVAGPVATMLLGDYGATVTKIEPPGGDRFRSTAGYTVWMRNKRSIEIDLKSAAGASTLRSLAEGADVLVESYAPGTTARLGIDYDTLRGVNERLVYCSITGYGSRGPLAGRPGYDALVQARSGIQNEQPGLRDGPIFLHAPLPSHGAALLASVAIHAALHTRSITGRGQHVETSLMQGALLWMTQIWQRSERPTPALANLWKFKNLGPTPCFEAADGQWFHPMPGGVPVALAHLGRDPAEIPFGDLASGDHAARAAYFEAVRLMYLQRPRDEWVELLQRSDVPCQPITAAEPSLDHPQILNNRTSTTVHVPDVGPVKQFGHAYHLEHHDEQVPAAPPSIGQHNHETTWPIPLTAREARPPAAGGSVRFPLDGIRVLDFGTALAGPFGPMILSDLGADVIKIDPLFQAGTTGDATYAACHRGKRSIAIDLKTAGGQAIASELIKRTDIVHYNLRTGVAERLGFDYERAKELNPSVIFCHLTAYGNTGPLARWPGVDQMGQALCGLEYEQGGTPNGGHPSWYRYGMCDATTGMLSILGVLQALGHRDRTGEGQAVEANILSGAMLLASDAFVGPESLPTRPHLDARQTGVGPLYRLYETADGWICVVASTEEHRVALSNVVGLERLDGAELEAQFLTQTAKHWQDVLDAAGVPCETASIERGKDWYDDPDVVANGWVASYEHPTWGRLDQPGRFFEFSDTPSRIFGPPPMIGQHTREILAELGHDDASIDRLRADGVVGW
ncbi:MAG: CoA transferase [Acidimicrobiia bacterium]|nr:CoA transferase [Acidimicrobiia bacterium]